jgi:hypothetical protein
MKHPVAKGCTGDDTLAITPISSALMDSYDTSTKGGKCAHPRLLSCACCPASAWLVTLPLSRALELQSGEVQTVLQHCLGLAILPLTAPTMQRGCGSTLHRLDTDHGMFTLRHDILEGILRCAVHRAGITFALETPPPSPRPCCRGRHFCRRVFHPPLGSGRHPPGPTTGHLHQRYLCHPPPLPKHHLLGG